MASALQWKALGLLPWEAWGGGAPFWGSLLSFFVINGFLWHFGEVSMVFYGEMKWTFLK